MADTQPASDGLCLLTPASRDYAFGGERLGRYGKRLKGRTAETWEFSLYPERESTLRVGGERLDDYLARVWALEAADRASLPLVKLLDVQGQLPVHCHPGDAQAAAMVGADPGKDEAWLILETGPEAAVYLGFKAPLTNSEIVRAVAEGSLRARMNRIAPRAGDVVLVPSGVPHSARDVVLWEVQQRSDRSLLAEAVDLWGRPLDGGAVRAGLDAFLAAVRRMPPPDGLHATAVLRPGMAPGERIPLAGCAHFSMEAVRLDGEAVLPPGAYTVAAGMAQGGDGSEARLGDTFVVGPGPGRLRAMDDGVCLLRAWRPGDAESAAARAAGRYFEGA
jgi:hypothetical protein